MTDLSESIDTHLQANGEPEATRRAGLVDADGAAPRETFLLAGGRLPVILRADAAVAGLNGLAYLVASAPLGRLLGLPAGLLLAAGTFLMVYGLGVWAVARPLPPARSAVQAVIAANAIWVLDSLVLFLAGWFSPTTAGQVWILLQATTVAAFAALQWRALRHQR